MINQILFHDLLNDKPANLNPYISAESFSYGSLGLELKNPQITTGKKLSGDIEFLVNKEPLDSGLIISFDGVSKEFTPTIIQDTNHVMFSFYWDEVWLSINSEPLLRLDNSPIITIAINCTKKLVITNMSVTEGGSKLDYILYREPINNYGMSLVKNPRNSPLPLDDPRTSLSKIDTNDMSRYFENTELLKPLDLDIVKDSISYIANGMFRINRENTYTNVALFKPVTIYKSLGYTSDDIHNLTNGLTNKYFLQVGMHNSSASGYLGNTWVEGDRSKAYIEVDLLGEFLIDRVVVYPTSSGNRVLVIARVEISLDKETWVEVYKNTSDIPNGDTNLDFTVAKARYVRFYGTTGESSTHYLGTKYLKVFGVSTEYFFAESLYIKGNSVIANGIKVTKAVLDIATKKGLFSVFKGDRLDLDRFKFHTTETYKLDNISIDYTEEYSLYTTNKGFKFLEPSKLDSSVYFQYVDNFGLKTTLLDFSPLRIKGYKLLDIYNRNTGVFIKELHLDKLVHTTNALPEPIIEEMNNSDKGSYIKGTLKELLGGSKELKPISRYVIALQEYGVIESNYKFLQRRVSRDDSYYLLPFLPSNSDAFTVIGYDYEHRYRAVIADNLRPKPIFSYEKRDDIVPYKPPKSGEDL